MSVHAQRKQGAAKNADNIKVAIRLRPLLPEEVLQGAGIYNAHLYIHT